MIFSILFFFSFFVLLFSYDSNVLASKNHKITGYAWSENLGWLSLNCYNDGLANKCLQSDYGLDYDKEKRTISGFGWSEYAGWVCFGKACYDVGFTKDPDNKDTAASLNDAGLLDGWANWLVLGSNGWLKLLGPQISAVGAKTGCLNCAKLKGQASEQCGLCFGQANYGGSAEICENCSNCSAGKCESCASCYNYGLGIDYSTNKIVGWSWNGNSTQTGFGWTQFHPATAVAKANAPYLQTIGGDVYSAEGIGSLYQGVSPEGQENATFMLQSNGSIVHFNSTCEKTGNCESSSGWVSDNIGVQTLPTRENSYRSNLGPLDIKGLLAGQYGEMQKIYSESQIPNALYGKVYYSAGDLKINSAKIFLNSSSTVKARGTIVVRGDLYLNNDLYYQNSAVKGLNKLSSVGFIAIKKDDGSGGNIYIDPKVQKLVGGYFAENTIYSGTYGDSTKEVQLEVQGLMVANAFKFQRQKFNLEDQEPAERIIYDGRVIVNPAPGFVDLAKALPEWK